MKSRIVVAALVLILVSAVVFWCFFADKTVGSSVPFDSINEFSCSWYSTAFPAENTEYRFVRSGSGWTYSYKHLKGEHLPLTEEDLIDSCTLSLSDEQTARFYSFLESGKVSRHKESVEAGGSGPWYLIRFSGDRDSFIDFSFADYDREESFHQFCSELK